MSEAVVLEQDLENRGKPNPGAGPSTGTEISVVGPRKLVRPSVPPGLQRRQSARTDPMFSHQAASNNISSSSEHSHAEAFYFQKQIHTQTLMVIVLEAGDKIEGYIEWWDKDCIKVRTAKTRMIVYKSSIKYLHKANENA